MENNTQKFQAEFQGKYAAVPAINRFALEYHQRTEDFDRTHCRGRRGKIAIPAMPEEITACTANAIDTRERMFDAFIAPLGFSKSEWRRIICEKAREFEAVYNSGGGVSVTPYPATTCSHTFHSLTVEEWAKAGSPQMGAEPKFYIGVDPSNSKGDVGATALVELTLNGNLVVHGVATGKAATMKSLTRFTRGLLRNKLPFQRPLSRRQRLRHERLKRRRWKFLGHTQHLVVNGRMESGGRIYFCEGRTKAMSLYGQMAELVREGKIQIITP